MNEPNAPKMKKADEGALILIRIFPGKSFETGTFGVFRTQFRIQCTGIFFRFFFDSVLLFTQSTCGSPMTKTVVEG